MAIALADARRRVGGEGAAGGGPAPSDAPPAEPAGAGGRADATAGQLRRLAIAQLELAMQTLRSAGPHDAEPAVHDARKAIKRARSTLRLLGAELAPQTRRRTRDALRDAGRALMEARDAAVAPSSLRRIVRRDRARLGASIGTVRLRTLLSERRAALERSLLAPGGGRHLALRRLSDAHAELTVGIGTLQEAAAARASVRAEMQRIYRRGRRQMRRAARDGQPAQMHLWRKRVKDLRYAAEALAAHGPAAARKRMLRTARSADALGEILGEEHDLAVLADLLAAERELFAQDRAGRKALVAAIDRRRRRLRKRALRDGRALYRRPPGRFSRPLAEPRR